MDQLTDNDTDPHDTIERLEAQIEALHARIENCRKFEAAARFALLVGGALLLAMMVGVMAFDPLALIAALVGLLGGVVVLGSNKSTREQAAAELAKAESRRADLIGSIELQTVPGRTLH